MSDVSQLQELISQGRINLKPTEEVPVSITAGTSIEEIIGSTSSGMQTDILISSVNVPHILKGESGVRKIICLGAILTLDQVILLHQMQQWEPATPHAFLRAVIKSQCFARRQPALATLDNPVGGLKSKSILRAIYHQHGAARIEVPHFGFEEPGPSFFKYASIVVEQRK